MNIIFNSSYHDDELKWERKILPNWFWFWKNT